MPALEQASEWDLPRLRTSFAYLDDVGHSGLDFFDVKFYPYSPPGADPVFAVVGLGLIIVCRLVQTKEKDKDANPCEVIQVIKDDGDDAANYGCCWSKDPETERPWLCVCGKDAKIKVFDIKEAKLVKTLVGHGGCINDLATSPADPSIIASCSDDFTIRIWSVAKAHERQPCLGILGGEGHSWDVLTVSFHQTGRYILSAGHDEVINLWTLPDWPKEHADAPAVLLYPHFATSQVHSGLVDCVAFFGDLILSRACHEDRIVLWRIEGFNSADPPLPPSQAPTAYDPSKATRSAFNPVPSASHPAQYTRLLQFHTPGCAIQFFMRFKIFHAPGKHPVLAFCNAKSRVLFWDLARLPAYNAYLDALMESGPSDEVERPRWLQLRKQREKKPGGAGAENHLSRRGSVYATGDKESMVSASPAPDPGRASASAAGGEDEGDGDGDGGASDGDVDTVTNAALAEKLGLNRAQGLKVLHEWSGMYTMEDPHGMLEPHRNLPSVSNEGNVNGRQVAWSPGGEWCVVVGSGYHVIVYQRWPRGDAK